MRHQRVLLAVLVVVSGAWEASSLARRTNELSVDPASSRVSVHVGKSGMLGFAGHEHEVVAEQVSGHVAFDPADWQRASVSLEFGAVRLRVTGKGEPPADVPEVQRVMASDRVLDVTRFPTISFRSRRVSIVRRTGDGADVVIDGDLTLHGATRPVTVKAAVALDAQGGITARGTASVKQTDFGIDPVTAGGGTVRVKDVVDVEFAVRAR